MYLYLYIYTRVYIFPFLGDIHTLMWGDPFLLKVEQFLHRLVQWSTAGQIIVASVSSLSNQLDKELMICIDLSYDYI